MLLTQFFNIIINHLVATFTQLYLLHLMFSPGNIGLLFPGTKTSTEITPTFLYYCSIIKYGLLKVHTWTVFGVSSSSLIAELKSLWNEVDGKCRPVYQPCNTSDPTSLIVSSLRDNRHNPKDKFAPAGWAAVSADSLLAGREHLHIAMATEFPLQKKSRTFECVLQLEDRYLKQASS